MINSVRSKILNVVPPKTRVDTPFELSGTWTQLYWIQLKLAFKLPTPQQAGVGESAGLIIKLKVE
jgi:hypothetical protein